jgi:hypothetical protein
VIEVDEVVEMRYFSIPARGNSRCSRRSRWMSLEDLMGRRVGQRVERKMGRVGRVRATYCTYL